MRSIAKALIYMGTDGFLFYMFTSDFLQKQQGRCDEMLLKINNWLFFYVFKHNEHPHGQFIDISLSILLF